MLVLSLDTAAGLCAACVWEGDAQAERGRAVLPMRTGHAEHLMDAVQAALRAAGAGFADIARIGVSVGPGSFTGIRVGVAAARGLALALKVPAVGISTLEALAAEARERLGAQAALAALETSGGRVQAAVYDGRGMALRGPAAVEIETALAWAGEVSALAGNAAERLAAALPGKPVAATGATADIAVYARLAARREAGEKPVPLYLRAPDAKPQGAAVLPRRAG